MGKYWEKDVRIMVPISVQTHYSFIDGIHIGEFVDSLEKYFCKFLTIKFQFVSVISPFSVPKRCQKLRQIKIPATKLAKKHRV
ncbi:MAG: CatA-like O-acetyltransferase [Anaerosacchariphilus sp.]